MAEILILGGGTGGLVVANELREALPSEHRVTLVERGDAFVLGASLLWLLVGERDAHSLPRPLAPLASKGIEVVRGEIERIDVERMEAVVAGRTLRGDRLVIALGADLDAAHLPGLAEAGHSFYTLAGADSFRDALGRLSGGRIVLLTAAPAYKCPAAPYEAAMLVEDACRKRGIRDRTSIDLYAAEPGPMGVAGPTVSAEVRRMVEAKGIGYHPEHQIVRADAAARRLVFANGASASYDLLGYVAPHRAPRVVQEAGLLGESGWIPVDRSSMKTRFERVYALGDVTGVPLKMGKPLPKAGTFARGEAEVVAREIVRELTGAGAPASFAGEGECWVETGGGLAAYGSGHFFAEPVPQVELNASEERWHSAKVDWERDFTARWLGGG